LSIVRAENSRHPASLAECAGAHIEMTQQDGKKYLSRKGFREHFENFFMAVLSSS
jgi:hypothetical protein